MERLMSLLGLFVMLIIAWLFSADKKRMDWRVIIGGILLQFLFALLILKTDTGRLVFEWANDAIKAVVSLSDTGAEFLFGGKYKEHFFAFSVLPTIIFISSVSYLLFYWGVLQKIVGILAYIMSKVMNISGVESLAAAANIFIGMTEAPLLIKPYLKTMTRSELACMMTGGMATVAGGVMGACQRCGI